MGIYDRDYMRQPERETPPGKPRAHLRRAANRPPFWHRLRFWLWRLFTRR